MLGYTLGYTTYPHKGMGVMGILEKHAPGDKFRIFLKEGGFENWGRGIIFV